MSDNRTENQSFNKTEFINWLHDESANFSKALHSTGERKLTKIRNEIENINGFIETLELIQETLSPERFQETIRNALRSIRKYCENVPREILQNLPNVTLDAKTGYPQFLIQAFQQIGPRYRMSQNGMSLWISVDSLDASFYSAEEIESWLNLSGFTYGIDISKIQTIFDQQQFDQEVCVGQGTPPKPGQSGHIEFVFDLDDLNLIPKQLEDGSVSFKDIKLFEYVQAGETIAKKVPPVPGKPGYTVTNQLLSPPEVSEAEFPFCDHTKISDDGHSLITTEDCCLTKKNGVLLLDPTLKIDGSVAYQTGNIDAKVTVVITENVQSGFSVQSEKTICVQGVVEGAKLEAKEEIIVKGGVHGKDTAVLESNQGVKAKFISNASVFSIGDVSVEAEIINSKIYSGSRVVVSKEPGQIVGGEIDADHEVCAATIGSELGIKTWIRLGGRTDDLSTMLLETQDKISQQEEAQEKCNQVLEMLKMQEQHTTGPSKDIEEARNKALSMREEIEKSLNELYGQQESLQAELDESMNHTRMVRAKQNIYPGTVISINNVELTIHEPTGPAIVMNQGSENVILPYTDPKPNKKL